jgi:hypothetical protein
MAFVIKRPYALSVVLVAVLVFGVQSLAARPLSETSTEVIGPLLEIRYAFGWISLCSRFEIFVIVAPENERWRRCCGVGGESSRSWPRG